MANTTRNQFDESKGVQRKILQKGVMWADADFNEQMDILQQVDRRTLSALTKHQSCRFLNGFLIEGTGADLAVTARAGLAAIQIGTNLAVLVRLAEDQTISGFTAWSGSRTDYIYLDIVEEEFSASDDANIINPDVGEETCRDIRLSATIKLSEGSAPGTPPSGHTYVTLATVIKTSGSTINAGDVFPQLKDFFRDPEGLNIDGGFSVQENTVLQGTLTANGLSTLSGGAEVTGSLQLDGSEVFTHASTDIASTNLADNSVITAKIADANVTTPKIADGAVTQPKLGSAAVATNNLADGAATEAKIADGAVSGTKLASGAIGPSQLADDAVIRGKVSSDLLGTGLLLDADDSVYVTGVREVVGGEIIGRYVTARATGVDFDTNGSVVITVPAFGGSEYMIQALVFSVQLNEIHDINEAGHFVFDRATNEITVYRDAAGVFDASTFNDCEVRVMVWHTLALS